MTSSADGSTAADGHSAAPGTVPLDHAAVEKIMQALSMTDDNEMSCAEVFALLDEYADGTVIDEADAEVLIPLIEKHLEFCKDCHECYDMLHAMVEPADEAAIGDTWLHERLPPNPAANAAEIRTIRAVWNGVVLAEADHTEMVEGNHYFPPDCINRQYFRDSDRHTTCHWKGEASYFDIIAGDAQVSNAAWYYPEPKAAASNIKDHVAFYGMVTIER